VNPRRVGHSLRAVRLRLGLTQDELGVASGTSRFIVQRIEAGQLVDVPSQRCRGGRRARR
jgi:predicted transcriptional regulator